MLIAFIVICGFCFSRAESAPALPPEIATLDVQFLFLYAERVTGPFDEGVKKLTVAYLDRVTKMIAEQKAAGNLDAIIAFDEELVLITAKQTIPETDDEKTPHDLKAMRVIYRQAYAKLVATRLENLVDLTAPFDKRLAQIESDLTKADRITDAKVVRGYRVALGKSSTSIPDREPVAPVVDGTKMNVSPTANPGPPLAPKDGAVNSLGMKFVPVKGTDVLFCIHEVRYKDYAAYAADAPGVNGYWKELIDRITPSERPEDHPVIKVSWDDTQKFCAWLSKNEGKVYRLPTDQEWSVAVGIGQDEKWKSDTTPATVFKNQVEFPWGKEWPPPKGAGNYCDISCHAKHPNFKTTWLEMYDDTFPATAPVMSFEPNKFGLYDMGGNVWEWVEDWYDIEKKDRVLRGGSWIINERGYMLSSGRLRYAPGTHGNSRGFRLVLVSSR